MINSVTTKLISEFSIETLTRIDQHFYLVKWLDFHEIKIADIESSMKLNLYHIQYQMIFEIKWNEYYYTGT